MPLTGLSIVPITSFFCSPHSFRPSAAPTKTETFQANIPRKSGPNEHVGKRAVIASTKFSEILPAEQPDNSRTALADPQDSWQDMSSLRAEKMK